MQIDPLLTKICAQN